MKEFTTEEIVRKFKHRGWSLRDSYNNTLCFRPRRNYNYVAFYELTNQNLKITRYENKTYKETLFFGQIISNFDFEMMLLEKQLGIRPPKDYALEFSRHLTNDSSFYVYKRYHTEKAAQQALSQVINQEWLKNVVFRIVHNPYDMENQASSESIQSISGFQYLEKPKNNFFKRILKYFKP